MELVSSNTIIYQVAGESWNPCVCVTDQLAPCEWLDSYNYHGKGLQHNLTSSQGRSRVLEEWKDNRYHIGP